MKIEFELNGERREENVPGMTRLLDLLREDMGATGAKEGCGEGVLSTIVVSIVVCIDGLRLQTRDDAVQTTGQSQHVQTLVLLTNRILRVNLGAVDVPALDRSFHLRRKRSSVSRRVNSRNLTT